MMYSIQSREKIFAVLLHPSFNFAGGIAAYGGIRKEMEVDEVVWEELIVDLAAAGVNAVVLNLDDAVAWDSHPEIAVRNAWSTARLRKEIAKMRKVGIEPIPMLNFSTSHDAWMKSYSRMVSSAAYYQLCRDLIDEAIAIFETPRFFHIGMDEETARHQQSRYDYLVVRKNELWWNDLLFYVDEIQKRGVRAWMWSDYAWNHPDLFFDRMPKSVVQSNWYYGEQFDLNRLEKPQHTYVNTYFELAKNGFDQLPTSKFYTRETHDYSIPHDEGSEKNVINTIRFGERYLAGSNLLGYLVTFWKPMIARYRPRYKTGAAALKEARKQLVKGL